jgi:hypothetical protein
MSFERIRRLQRIDKNVVNSVTNNTDNTDKKFLENKIINDNILDNKKAKPKKYSYATDEYFNALKKQDPDDDIYPFLFNNPPLQNLSDLADLKKSEVLSIFTPKSINKTDIDCELVTIIPFKKRTLHLIKTLDSLVASINQSGKNIKILIVENSKIKLGEEIIKDFKDVEYRWIDSKGRFFNKCICHNVGTYITKSRYVHFHDCDLLVPENFYDQMFLNLESNKAIQCFSGRSVNYFKEEPSKEYFDGSGIIPLIISTENYMRGGYGAPGGSIALARELYEDIGGFDPHFFWGYSCEDSFFWKKMEYKTQIGLLENPKIELFHLWHPSASGKSTFERFEQKINQFLNNDNMESYLKKARELYSMFYSILIID